MFNVADIIYNLEGVIMGLSDKDNQAFESIVASLQDVKESTAKTAGEFKLRNIIFGVVLGVVGIVIMVVGVSLKLMILGIAGFGVAFFGMVLFFDAYMKKSKVVAKKPRRDGFRERYLEYVELLEERNRKRWENGE